MRRTMMLAGLGFLAAVACTGPGNGMGPDGFLRVRVTMENPLGVITKASSLSDYYFLLFSSAGDTLLQQTVGEVTESPMSLPAGSYRIAVYNRIFSLPEFDAPWFMAKDSITILSGQECEVSLTCKQVNAGIKVDFTQEVIDKFPQLTMSITSALGTLVYDKQSMGKWGYFLPGDITLSLQSSDSLLKEVQRRVQAKTMYTYSVALPDETSELIAPIFTLSVDTTRTWTHSRWDDTDHENDGQTPATAFEVSQARSLTAGLTDVWVQGYVIGHLKTGGTLILSNFDADTHIALAESPAVTDTAGCMAINVPTGKIRELLGLLSNPSILGKKIYVKGKTVSSYFNLPGLNPTAEATLAE